jgi:hypothetical protein
MYAHLEPWMGHATVPVMDTATAHIVMQKHILCSLLFCPLKHQAHVRLVQAGKLVPAKWP